MGVGRPAGGKKFAGRKKGTVNKSTQSVIDKANALGVDPFEVLLLFAKGDWEKLGYPTKSETRFSSAGIEFEVDYISAEVRVKAASDCCQYLYPKRKAIEVSGPDGNPIEGTTTIDLKNVSVKHLKIMKMILSK